MSLNILPLPSVPPMKNQELLVKAILFPRQNIMFLKESAMEKGPKAHWAA